MTIQEWADRLNGREYRSELEPGEEKEAAADGAVIIYGASDDLMEIAGAINDEVGCFGGGEASFSDGGILSNECYDTDCPYFKRLCDRAMKIRAIWDKDGYSWVYETDIPHATFDIMEDGEKYCRGIVFALSDVA